MDGMNRTVLPTSQPDEKVQPAPFRADAQRTEEPLLILLRLTSRQQVRASCKLVVTVHFKTRLGTR